MKGSDGDSSLSTGSGPRGFARRLVAHALLIPLGACAPGPGPPVTGELLDHRTGEPIAGAEVRLERQGWGRSASGQILWDRRYHARTVTDSAGAFSLELPGSTLLVGQSRGTLSVTAVGHHPLRLRVEGRAPLSLHTIPHHSESAPGGVATVGLLRDGTPAGWSFVEHRTVTDPDVADILVESMAPAEYRATLAVPPGGGLLFVPFRDQSAGTLADGHLLRFMDEPPSPPDRTRLTLGREPGTLFVRTRDHRYAKLSWNPEVAFARAILDPDSGAALGDHLSLPFLYRPLPGRFLPYQPPVSTVDPLHAAAAAEIGTGEGSTPPGPGAQQARGHAVVVELRGPGGIVLDHRIVALEAGRPVDVEFVPSGLTGPRSGVGSPWRYRNLELRFDEEGLPQVALTVQGPNFASHFLPRWVSRRLETPFPFDAHLVGEPRPVPLELRIRRTS